MSRDCCHVYCKGKTLRKIRMIDESVDESVNERFLKTNECKNLTMKVELITNYNLLLQQLLDLRPNFLHY